MKYTIEEIEDIANAWSWKNPQNRSNYHIVIDFLCEIEPKLKKLNTNKTNDKMDNLIIEIASIIDCGSITVGALGLSQDSADYIMELARRIKTKL